MMSSISQQSTHFFASPATASFRNKARIFWSKWVPLQTVRFVSIFCTLTETSGKIFFHRHHLKVCGINTVANSAKMVALQMVWYVFDKQNIQGTMHLVRLNARDFINSVSANICRPSPFPARISFVEMLRGYVNKLKQSAQEPAGDERVTPTPYALLIFPVITGFALPTLTSQSVRRIFVITKLRQGELSETTGTLFMLYNRAAHIGSCLANLIRPRVVTDSRAVFILPQRGVCFE